MVEVRQEDRLLVADILDEVSDLLDHTGIGQVADLIRDGEYDEHDCVVIATRHRIAALDAARGDPVARLIAHMKTIEPDEETAGCPATWADFIQILEGIAEAGDPFNG